MNLSWLDDFLALASTGNFSRAAQERHMTQPAFGRRVRALEDWLGTELFDRSSQPIRLTPAGQWLHGVAQGLLAQVARVPGEARAVAEANSNALRFAATHALSFTFMPGWLRRFEACTMGGAIQLESDVMQRCEALMEHSTVQFVMCHAHPLAPGRLQTEGYPSVQIGADVLVPVCAVGAHGQPLHPLQPLNPALPRPAGAAAVPLLSYSDASGLGRILQGTVHPALINTPTQTVFTAHLASVLRTLVLDGRGMAWLPQSLITDDLAAGRLVPAAPEAWCVELEIRLYRAHGAMGRAAEALWTAVTQAASAAPAELTE